MRKIRGLIVALSKTILKSLLFLFPIKKNKIVFINFNGRGYGCNPKYIAEEILSHDLDFDLVWPVNDMNDTFPQGIRKVEYRPNIKYFYEVATAKVIVTNVKNDLGLFKKKGQYVIQTWHGSMGGKRAEGDALDTLSPQYIKESRHNSKQTDLFLSNSRALSDYYRKAFWCECEIMECGSPRNDIFFRDNASVNAKVREFFGISPNSKIALYAPTFRDDGSGDAYSLSGEKVLSAFNNQGGDWVLLIRMHPNASEFSIIFSYGERILDATSYPDMQELLCVSDALITDYSSTVFEMASMKKAIYIYATDFEEYNSKRGLLPDFFTMPYHFNKTEEQLIETISNDTAQSIKANSEAFIKNFGCVDNGTASKQVVERIKQIIGINR